jgi:hypothetical protein
MSPDDRPTQIDLVLLALLNLGGDTGMVDLEDLAMEAFRLSPQAFRWRKYPQPSLEAVRLAIKNANRPPRRLIASEPGGEGRMLTDEGVDAAHRVARRASPEGVAASPVRRSVTAELGRITSHPAFLRWRTSGWAAVDIFDVADIARCAASAAPATLRARLLSLRAQAEEWGHTEIEQFLGEAAEHLARLLQAAPEL